MASIRLVGLLLVIHLVALTLQAPSRSLAGSKETLKLYSKATKLYQAGNMAQAKQTFLQCIDSGAYGELLYLSHYNTGATAYLWLLAQPQLSLCLQECS